LTKRDLGVIGCRLIAIYAIVQGFVIVPYSLQLPQQRMASAEVWTKLWAISPSALQVIAGLLVWFLAPALARAAVPDEATGDGSPHAASMAVLLVGALMLVKLISSLSIYFFIQMMRAEAAASPSGIPDSRLSENTFDVSQNLIWHVSWLIVTLGLILGARWIASFASRPRTAAEGGTEE
jgi:hypothetical protein